MSDSRILVVESDDARAERIGALLDFLDFTPKRIGAVDELDLARAKPRDWLAIVVGGVEDLEDFRRFGGWLSKSPLHPPLLVLPALHGLTEQLGCTRSRCGRWTGRCAIRSWKATCAAPACRPCAARSAASATPARKGRARACAGCGG